MRIRPARRPSPPARLAPIAPLRLAQLRLAPLLLAPLLLAPLLLAPLLLAPLLLAPLLLTARAASAAGGGNGGGSPRPDQAFLEISPAFYTLGVYLAFGGALITLILLSRTRPRRDFEFIERVFGRSVLVLLLLALLIGMVVLVGGG